MKFEFGARVDFDRISVAVPAPPVFKLSLLYVFVSFSSLILLVEFEKHRIVVFFFHFSKGICSKITKKIARFLRH